MPNGNGDIRQKKRKTDKGSSASDSGFDSQRMLRGRTLPLYTTQTAETCMYHSRVTIPMLCERWRRHSVQTEGVGAPVRLVMVATSCA